MLKNTKWYLSVLAAVLLVTASCTNDALDDGTGADGNMEIDAFAAVVPEPSTLALTLLGLLGILRRRRTG